MNLSKLIPVAFLFPLLSSCSSDRGEEISTYLVERGNFQHVLRLDGMVEPVRSTTLKCPQRVDAIITFIVDEGTWVEKGDTLCILEDASLAATYEELLLEVEQSKGSLRQLLASNDMQKALLESQFYTNEAETKIASLDSLELEYLPPAQKKIRELQLEVVMLERKKLEEKLKLTPIVQNTEVRRYQMMIQRMERFLKEYKERLESLTIVAPKKGMAMRAMSYLGRKLMVGDNVWNGRDVIIMPEMSKMKVLVKASETNFNAINEKDSIIYNFDAMPGEMGFGRVTKKNMAWKPVKQGSNVKVYEFEASIDSTTKMPDPGFTTQCNVMLREMRDTIFIPQITIFNEDSLKAVFVKQKNGFELRQVITGISSNKEAVIAAGLEGGEEIAFIRPKDSQVKSRKFLPDSILIKYGEKVAPADTSIVMSSIEVIKPTEAGTNEVR